MKTTITINGKSVEIELTKKQVDQIKKQSVHYTDIKTLQDALDYNGEIIEEFNNRTKYDDNVQRAYKELEVIVKAVRQGNELGTTEKDVWYYPWFYSDRSSRGFFYDGYGYTDASLSVSSRLCVESSEKAKYLGTQFLSTYERYIKG